MRRDPVSESGLGRGSYHMLDAPDSARFVYLRRKMGTVYGRRLFADPDGAWKRNDSGAFYSYRGLIYGIRRGDHNMRY